MTEIPLAALQGTWHIVQTNFPMWLKGDKTAPMIRYQVKKEGESSILLDEVSYTKNDKSHRILGYSRPTNARNAVFTWQGRGVLGFLKSQWRILYFDIEREWAIIWFEKTLFTPEGFDVIAKNPSIDERWVQSKLKELYLMPNPPLISLVG